MRLTARLALLLLFALPGAVGAQSLPANVGDNANILPVYKSTPPGEPPAADDYLRGNLLGQRCNEASIGISSINPDHMMVFCNDYRATFNWDDSLVPSGKTTLVASVWSGVKTFLAWVTGQPAPQRKAPRIIASAEAGIGGGVSYDGGVTWQGFMVPGGPNDSSPASLAHPGKALNLQGYSDPWAVTMKDGRVGVAYIGFTRDKVTGQSTQSGVFFTRYRDRNASDTVHDWEYEFSSQVALSNNLTQGQFLDKVSATVGPNGTLYVAFTRFTGSSGSSSIFLAQSTDGGRVWTAAAIDKDSKYGQGTVVLAHPTNGAVGVLWRTFVSSSLVFKSTAKGAKNVDLFLNDPDGPYRPFDQYSQAINTDPNRVAFRTLAFPSAAYTPDGSRLVAVFPEWIDLDTMKPGTTGRPMPMVVMKVSTDRGATWSRRYVLNQLNGDLGGVPASPEKLGFFSPARAVGAQLMPAVACTIGSQCMVVWKQSYSAGMAVGGTENPGSLVTSGIGRRFDVRGALVSFPGPHRDGELPGLALRVPGARADGDAGPGCRYGRLGGQDGAAERHLLPDVRLGQPQPLGRRPGRLRRRLHRRQGDRGPRHAAPRSWWRSPTTATTSCPTRRRRAAASRRARSGGTTRSSWPPTTRRTRSRASRA